MRLTIVLALMCLAQTVLSAPAVDPRHHAAKVNAASKNTLSDPLELELQGVHQQNQPIRTHGENEAPISSEEKEIVDNDVEQEVKRSERVSAEDVDPHGEDLDGLSDNLEAADQDVKNVLRVFLHSLKQHPEIVEDIMEKEGEKLLGHPLSDDGENPTAFQEPSPQLTKIPKQVEKKAGGEFPRFIYKSPMRNAFERNQMTAGSINNDAGPLVQPSHNNEVPVAESPFVDPHDVSDVKATGADLSNAIPVIQQPNANQDTLEDQIHILPDQPEENGPIDIAALQQAQDEYSHENPFINSLPLFPEHKEQQEPQGEVIVEPDQSHVQPLDADAPEDDVPHLLDTEIVNTDLAPEEDSDVIKEGGESEEKRSQDVLKSGEGGKESDAEVKTEEEDDEDQETEITPTEAGVEESVPNSPKTKPPHHLTGSEIAANMLHHPVESESSVPYYYYYYDYNKDGGRVPGGNLAASKEGEHEEEELENISNQNRPTEAGSETDEDEEDEEEHSHEDSEEIEEEETDGDDEGEGDTEDVDEDDQEGDEDTDDVPEEDEAREGDEEGEEDDSDTEEEENDLDEEEEEGHDEEDEGENEEEEVDDESDESTERTNSHKVIAVNEISRPEPTKQKVSMKLPLKNDKNEADLLSLKAEASSRPDGPAM